MFQRKWFLMGFSIGILILGVILFVFLHNIFVVSPKSLWSEEELHAMLDSGTFPSVPEAFTTESLWRNQLTLERVMCTNNKKDGYGMQTACVHSIDEALKQTQNINRMGNKDRSDWSWEETNQEITMNTSEYDNIRYAKCSYADITFFQADDCGTSYDDPIVLGKLPQTPTTLESATDVVLYLAQHAGYRGGSIINTEITQKGSSVQVILYYALRSRVQYDLCEDVLGAYTYDVNFKTGEIIFSHRPLIVSPCPFKPVNRCNSNDSTESCPQIF